MCRKFVKIISDLFQYFTAELPFNFSFHVICQARSSTPPWLEQWTILWRMSYQATGGTPVLLCPFPTCLVEQHSQTLIRKLYLFWYKLHNILTFGYIYVYSSFSNFSHLLQLSPCRRNRREWSRFVSWHPGSTRGNSPTSFPWGQL